MKTSDLLTLTKPNKWSRHRSLPRQRGSDRTGAMLRMMWRSLKLACLVPVIACTVVTVPYLEPVSAQILTDTLRVLRVGDRGPEVTQLQEALRARGVFVGTVDGVFGPQTEAAVRQFQIDQGLVVDGIYGLSTDIALFNTAAPTTPVTFSDFSSATAGSRTVRLGDRGSDVTELQQLLNNSGFNAGTADGVFGPTTQAAVESFQSTRGLTVDGVVGSATWSALGVTTTPSLIAQPPTFPTLDPLPPPDLTSLPPLPVTSNFPVVGQEGTITPLETILANGRYVVVVPGSSSQNLSIIQREIGSGFLTRSGRGSFTTPGAYPSYSQAQDIALRLRGFNLDARVEHF